MRTCWASRGGARAARAGRGWQDAARRCPLAGGSRESRHRDGNRINSPSLREDSDICDSFSVSMPALAAASQSGVLPTPACPRSPSAIELTQSHRRACGCGVQMACAKSEEGCAGALAAPLGTLPAWTMRGRKKNRICLSPRAARASLCDSRPRIGHDGNPQGSVCGAAKVPAHPSPSIPTYTTLDNAFRSPSSDEHAPQ
jgi:hypothetical protein